MTVEINIRKKGLPPQLKRLYKKVLHEQKKNPKKSRTAKLFAEGSNKIAKKVVEEATEVSLDYVAGNRQGVILETVDLLYNVMVLLADMNIDPREVWQEMERRDDALGLAAKLPKHWRI